MFEIVTGDGLMFEGARWQSFECDCLLVVAFDFILGNI